MEVEPADFLKFIENLLGKETFVSGFVFGVVVVLALVWTLRKLLTPADIKIMDRAISRLEAQVKQKDQALQLKDERLLECHKKQNELEAELKKKESTK